MQWSTTDHILWIFQILEGGKMGIQQSSAAAVCRLKNGNDSVRREVLCSVLMEFGILMKLVRIIKICLNKTYSRVQAGKHLSDMLHITNVLK